MTSRPTRLMQGKAARRLLPVFLGLAALAGCGGSGPAPHYLTNTLTTDSARVEVTITEFGYDPAVLVIPSGTIVCWSNPEYDDHAVTSDSGLFDFYTIACSGPYCFTFFFPGSYRYYDRMYPQVSGTIVVR